METGPSGCLEVLGGEEQQHTGGGDDASVWPSYRCILVATEPPSRLRGSMCLLRSRMTSAILTRGRGRPLTVPFPAPYLPLERHMMFTRSQFAAHLSRYFMRGMEYVHATSTRGPAVTNDQSRSESNCRRLHPANGPDRFVRLIPAPSPFRHYLNSRQQGADPSIETV